MKTALVSIALCLFSSVAHAEVTASMRRMIATAICPQVGVIASDIETIRANGIPQEMATEFAVSATVVDDNMDADLVRYMERIATGAVSTVYDARGTLSGAALIASVEMSCHVALQ